MFDTKIGWSVKRKAGDPDNPNDDDTVRGTDWHLIESVIAGDPITKCGKRLDLSVVDRDNIELSEQPPLTRMIGQPQLCGAGCYPELT